jgi:outer membrane protein assembly factor BamB
MLGAPLLFLLLSPQAAGDWPQFRGPNSVGVSPAHGLPVEFGPGKNMVWRTPLPPGHSSPVLSADRIFLTAHENERLWVFCLDRQLGRILWRREVPRPRKQELHKSNSPASPSVVTDGKNAYAFFTDFGLIAFGPDGNELWRRELGPFNNPFGMGASPVLARGKLLQICDSESGSFFVAVDAATGREVWRVDRPEFTRGFSTPVLYQPPQGNLQALVPGTNRLVAYDVETGREVWYVRGLTWQLKPTPVLVDGVLYVLGWAGGSDQGNQESLPTFEEILAAKDANKDGKLSKDETDDPRHQKDFAEADFDKDGFWSPREWERYRARRASVNSIMAIRPGGSGDITEKAVLWQYYKTLPNVPSPLVYQGVVYMMKEGGILTALDARDGSLLKQGRLEGALDFYYSSPVAADGKIFVSSQGGHLTVIRAGPDWTPLARNDFDEEIFATPAPAGNRLYVRTNQALYCFANLGPAN